MKCHGAIMEYAEERMKDLMRAYDEYISSCKQIRMDEVYSSIVSMASRRFWVSDERAVQVICSMLKGGHLGKMRPLKREMFEEIFTAIEELPAECRRIFKMSYIEHLSIQEIAKQLDIAETTIKTQRARAKKYLQDRLKELFPLAILLFF